MKKTILFILLTISTSIYATNMSNLFQTSSSTSAGLASGFGGSNMPSMTMNVSQDDISNKKIFINKAVAIVNNHPITSLELDQEVNKLQSAIPPSQRFNQNLLDIKKQALQNLIAQEVLYQLAKQNHISISDEQLNNSIKDIATRNGITIDSLKLNLEASGLFYKQYKDEVRKQLMINQLQQQAISQQVYVSPKEIQKYILKHKKQFDKEMEPVKTYTIKNFIVALPDNKKAAQEKMAELKKLAIAINKGYISFNDVVEQFSQAANVSNDGLIGENLKIESVPSLYKNIVPKLGDKKVSAPFIHDRTIQMVYVDNINVLAPIIDKEITKYYVYGIAVKTSDTMTDDDARNILSRAKMAIDAGQEFSKIAEKYNQNYDFANGDIGWVSRIDNPPVLPSPAWTKLASLKEDSLSEPFKATANTWMIVKYTKIEKYDAAKQLKEQKALEAIFSEKAAQIYKTWLASMKDNAYIEVLEPDLKTQDLY